MSAALSVQGLSAGYGGIRVLNDLSLEVPANEITVVVGPNGAGKTTLLKALSGLLPRTGSVTFDGTPLPEAPSAIVSAVVFSVMTELLRLQFPYAYLITLGVLLILLVLYLPGGMASLLRRAWRPGG